MCVSVANDTPTDDSKDTIRLVPDERERENRTFLCIEWDTRCKLKWKNLPFTRSIFITRREFYSLELIFYSIYNLRFAEKKVLFLYFHLIFAPLLTGETLPACFSFSRFFRGSQLLHLQFEQANNDNSHFDTKDALLRSLFCWNFKIRTFNRQKWLKWQNQIARSAF